MKIEIPELCLVLLVGASASGKSTFAHRHFLPTEVVASDACRAMLTDDENDQKATPDAFDLLRTIVGKRLKLGKLTVVDATNLQKASRKMLIELAHEYHLFCVAMVFDLPAALLEERHSHRHNRSFAVGVIRNQCEMLRRSLKGLEREGLRQVHRFQDSAEVEAVQIKRVRLWTNLRHETGPFDIIGDVHGCLTELECLLVHLGYVLSSGETADRVVSHPEKRRLIFLGDLVDRGPDSPGVVRLVRAIVECGMGFCVAGNHDLKLARALRGKPVTMAHGLERSMEQFARVTVEERMQAAIFLDRLISHYVLDDGRLVVAHAGVKESMQGRSSMRVREFALYGDTNGEVDEFGLPVRLPWAKEYRGEAMVVYGHTPVRDAMWINHTLCLDTGAVFGGKLTALRYPERELVSVDAIKIHYPPSQPLNTVRTEEPEAESQPARQPDDLLDFSEMIGKRRIETTLLGLVRMERNAAAAAMELMSRKTVDPRWLIHLPATMSPVDGSTEAGILEAPEEGFDYYRHHGIDTVICQEKHMGTRAIIIVCRSEAVSQRRFGVARARHGIIYTRTGQSFFLDQSMEQALLQRLAEGMEDSGLWNELQTDWVCLDAELLPWSFKAMGLVRQHFAPVAACGGSLFTSLRGWMEGVTLTGSTWEGLVERTAEKSQAISAYRRVLEQFCQGGEEFARIRIAPFHLLASEGQVHDGRPHMWHMERLSGLAKALPDLVIKTRFRLVDLHSTTACKAATAWWYALIEAGGEGMVIKPTSFFVTADRGVLQPALKCRGPEYLRIIYGPDYLLPHNLERLRQRELTAKRKRALQEFALGLEALHRFVARQPLSQVHACVFAILAMESEPDDPRL